MSLLLDALRRAEESKQQDSSLSLEPLSSPNPQQRSKPMPGNYHPRDSLTETQVRRPTSEREAAQAVFEAKENLPPQNRALWLLLGGLSLLSIIAGIFWLWYMLTFPNVKAPVPVVKNISPPITSASAQPPVSQSQKPVLPSKKVRRAEVTLPPIEPTQAPIIEEKPVTPKKQRRMTESLEKDRGPSIKRDNTAIKTINPDLASGYDALVNKNYLFAEQKYKQVIQADPFNIDAYLGLATIAASTGNLSLANNYYQKALEIDPKNTTAQAGLAALQSTQNITASESQLRAQIANGPPDAVAYTTLGHVYVTQKSWGEAQQAFFEAFRLNPSNPDYAFNLAVSLDHLHQYKLAREYYDKALQLGQTQPAEFDRGQVIARINQIAP